MAKSYPHRALDARSVERHLTDEDSPIELGTSDREDIGAECIFIRVQHNAAKTPRIAQSQRSPVCEVQNEPIPCWIVAIARVFERVDGGVAVDDDPPRHPEAEPERAVVMIEEQQLSSPTCGREARTGERCDQGFRRRAFFAEPFVVGFDRGHLSTERLLRGLAIDLDLHTLRHSQSLMKSETAGFELIADEAIDHGSKLIELDQEAVVAMVGNNLAEGHLHIAVGDQHIA